MSHTLHTLYTLGFWRKTPEQVKALADDLGAYVVDVRANPWTHIPRWRPDRLKPLLGALDGHSRYVWHGEALGLSRSGLRAPYAAVGPLRPLSARHNLILLCACQDWRHCHRTQAAMYLAGHLNMPVEHV
jgi:uncharacterized protein (DUF488 family)